MSEKSNFLKQLQGASGNRTKVRLTRPFPSERNINGFIVSIGRSLIILQQFHDFYCEGYAALRIADIIGFRSGKYERFWEQMLASEKLLENIGLPCKASPDSIFELLKSLRSRELLITVEIESEVSEDDDDFNFGKIVDLNPHAVSMLCLSALGIWDRKPTVILIEKISVVQFDTPYGNIFSRYARQSENP